MKKRLYAAKIPLGILGFWALFFLFFAYFRTDLSFIRGLTSVTRPLRQAIGGLCEAAPFSVAELLVLLFFLAILWYLCYIVQQTILTGSRALLRGLLGLFCIAVSVYGGFTLLWGADYYLPGFAKTEGFSAAPASVDTLEQVTVYFATQAAQCTVPRDENGAYRAANEQVFAASRSLYNGMEQLYPSLAGPVRTPKPLAFSRVLSHLQFTGFYFPFTGEANLNTDAPSCLLPATIAHELAHQRGITAENEANFVAILACLHSDHPRYQYAGYLLGYIHLSNALYDASPERWEQVWKSLPRGMQQDLIENNTCWNRYETKLSHLSDKFYDGFLKSFDQPLGTKSYGAVVDLLLGQYAA